jgi:hypothetical protein
MPQPAQAAAHCASVTPEEGEGVGFDVPPTLLLLHATTKHASRPMAASLPFTAGYLIADRS